jgi:amino acid adenylation domain-containing protein
MEDELPVELFEIMAARYRDKIAVKEGDVVLTYAYLCQWVHDAAKSLLAVEPLAGTNVGLLFDHGLETAVSKFAVLKAGKTYVPFDGTYPLKRLIRMCDRFEISIMITHSPHMELAEKLSGLARKPFALINLDHLHPSIHADREEPYQPGEVLFPQISEDTNAYIITTSGSDGEPKGVMQTRRNLRFYVEHYINRLGITPEDRLTYLSSFSHDGAVEDIYPALLSGAGLYPYNIKKRGMREAGPWLEKEALTIYHSVPTVFRYITGTFEPEAYFPAMRTVSMGAEPLRSHDLQLMRQHFPHARLAHMYGQTEASVNTLGFIDTSAETGIIPIGDPLEEIQLFLVNQDGDEVDQWEEGEIYVASSYLSPGYWEDPETTTVAYFEDDEVGRVYRTGDMGRRRLDDSIEFTGRKDNQVKIRGFRVEPGEIESCLLEIKDIQQAVVVSHDSGEGEAYLCAYVVAAPRDDGPGAGPPPAIMDTVELRDRLAAVLPEYMVPAYIVPLSRFPLTPNGKVDRNALPDPAPDTDKSYTVPRDEMERKLVKIWASVLPEQESSIGIDTSFFRLGGHSLRAAMLAARIYQAFHVEISLPLFFKSPTIRLLSRLIKTTGTAEFQPLKPVEKRDYYPQSSAQRRLFLLDRMGGIRTAYNMPYAVKMNLPLNQRNLERLETIFKRLIQRHESFRTSFHLVEDEPVQRVHGSVDFVVQRLKTPGGAERAIKEFIRPFDFSRPPLLRAGVAALSKKKSLLLLDMHHIISDGTSLAILFEDFTELYDDGELEPLNIQYKDFAVWQNAMIAQGRMKTREEYWKAVYPDSADIPLLNIPTDYPRPAVFDYTGRRYDFILAEEEALPFLQLETFHDVTLFMNLLSAFNILLSRYSGQQDIIVGTGAAGRNHVDPELVTGLFVNLLALRNRPGPQKSYLTFLNEVAAESVRALGNQDLQFERVLELVKPPRRPSHHPLFDVSLVIQNFEHPTASDVIGATETFSPLFSPYPFERGTSKYDFTLYAFQTDREIHFRLEYATALFKQDTIQRMAEHLLNIIRQVAADPDIPLSQIQLLSEDEKHQLLEVFNDTAAPSPTGCTIQDLFDRQVARTPDRIALSGDNRSYWSYRTYITYKHLHREAGRRASSLKRRGVRPGAIVAVKMERSVGMVIAILGILKAGCAYLPLDPAFPSDRIDYILKDSGAPVLIESESRLTLFNLEGGARCGRDVPGPAYVIYTSGSTGRPKGVIVEHRGIVNQKRFWEEETGFGVRTEDRVVQFANLTFDASVSEFFMAFFTGAALYLFPDILIADPGRFQSEVIRHCITVATLPPPYLVYLDPVKLPSLRTLITAGSEAQPEQVEQWRRHVKYINAYGPTEASICATCWHAPGSGNPFDSPSVPIGKPIANVQVYILSPYDTLQPVNVPGELCTGGAGVARGYLNKPELTAEKFVTVGTIHESPLHLYKTGDLARWLPGGHIEFLGRIDHQVKIRGFRIEPGEVQYHLLQHKSILDAWVTVLDGPANDGLPDMALCA